MQSPQINEMPDAVKDNLKEDKDKFECKSQCSGKSRLSAVSTIRSFFSPKNQQRLPSHNCSSCGKVLGPKSRYQKQIKVFHCNLERALILLHKFDQNSDVYL